MKYTIETTKGGCVETIELHDGSKYIKRHTKTSYGSCCDDKEYADQMEKDGICEEILDKVYDTFDSFIPNDFMEISELDC